MQDEQVQVITREKQVDLMQIENYKGNEREKGHKIMR